MDFLTKKVGRLGKKEEAFTVTFIPCTLKVKVVSPTYVWLRFKRGPQKDETKRYHAEPPSQDAENPYLSIIEFDNEFFARTSGFYRDKGDKY